MHSHFYKAVRFCITLEDEKIVKLLTKKNCIAECSKMKNNVERLRYIPKVGRRNKYTKASARVQATTIGEILEGALEVSLV